jgi:hypothetical protein
MCTTDQTMDVPTEDEVTELKRLLTESQGVASAYRQTIDRTRERLQEGLFDLDDDDRETVCDFLNEHTPWEFTTKQRFQVRVTVTLSFKADSEAQAEEIAEGIEVSEGRFSDAEDFEVEDVSVDQVEEG